MEDTTVADFRDSDLLPSKLRLALWRGVDRRLQRGSVLITTEHFCEVMETEFRRLVKIPPSRRIKSVLRNMVVAVNEEHPETYLTLGIRNAMTLYFRELDSRTETQGEDLLSESRRRIKAMVDEGRTAFFLESIGVEVPSTGVPASVDKAILKIVSGQRLTADAHAAQRGRHRRASSTMAPVKAGSATDGVDGPAVMELPDDEAREQRAREMERAQTALAGHIMERASTNLRGLVEQGLLEAEEVSALDALGRIDRRQDAGEIDAQEAQRLREQFAADIREKLRQRLRAAVDFSVHYVHAAESLKRLPEACDGALRLLVRHRALVLASDVDASMGDALEELQADEETLVQLSHLLERREREARMISANLPPYRYIMEGEGAAAEAMEEDFIADLRGLDRDQLADALNSEDAEVRAHLAARIRCLVLLIHAAMEPTPFHRAVRRLTIRRTLRRLYDNSVNAKSGRQKVQHFVNRRLVRLYPDMDAAERAEILQESRKMMDAMDADGEMREDGNELRFYRA